MYGVYNTRFQGYFGGIVGNSVNDVKEEISTLKMLKESGKSINSFLHDEGYVIKVVTEEMAKDIQRVELGHLVSFPDM